MQTRRRLFSVLAAVLFSVSIASIFVAGCSSKPSGGPLPDASNLVKQSADTSKNLKSAHVVLSVTGKVPGLPLKKLTGDLTTSPATAASGDADITIGGSDIDANFVVIDGELYATLTPNKWSDFGKAADIYDISAILAPDTGVANLLANFTDAKAESRDNIGGQTVIKVSGKVTADAVNKIGLPFDATQPVPTTVWIQETGDHQLVQVALEKSSGNSVQMTLSDWGKTVTVTKPPVS